MRLDDTTLAALHAVPKVLPPAYPPEKRIRKPEGYAKRRRKSHPGRDERRTEDIVYELEWENRRRRKAGLEPLSYGAYVARGTHNH